jgi:hypothetical protein
MTDRTMAWDDATLEAGLRGLGEAIAWPAPVVAPGGPDLASRVRARIVAEDIHPAVSRTGVALSLPRWRSGRRALVLALAALLVLAALAGAAALGLPGLRITLGEPSGPPPTTTPSGGAVPSGIASPVGPPGWAIGLGTLTTLEDAAAEIERPLPVPTDPTLGPPDAVYIDRVRADQVALVWAADADTPETLADGVGLIVMAFDGTVADDEMRQKIVGSGSTLEPVTVAGHPGFWIEGDPHIFFYRTPQGAFVDDGRRWVGDALLWSDGETTYRIESALGRDATIRIAESVASG